MAYERVQLNARVGTQNKQDVKVDAAKSNQTIDIVADAILTKFYRDNPDERQRAAIYRAHAEVVTAAGQDLAGA